MSNILLISFSGGRTSAYMTKLICDSPEYSEYEKVILFANTGKERIETLDFVKDCADNWGLKIVWVEAVIHHDIRKSSTHKVVSYHSASRNGEPFEEMIRKYGIPNQAFPHCTRELKLNPMKSYMKSLGHKDYTSAIGIRFDEPQRLSHNSKYIYPMYRMGINEEKVRGFWNQQCFDLQLKSYEGNCDLCWKKSLRKKRTLIKENPNIADWWIEMETKYSEGEYFFHRNNQSTKELASDQSYFATALDPYNYNAEMDDEKACNCRTILNEES